MRLPLACSLLFALIAYGLLPGQARAGTPDQPVAPVKVIFDTDMDSDCDDAGALA